MAEPTLDQDPAVLRAEAARLLLSIKKAQISFEGFVRLLNPRWEFPKYQRWLIRVLDLFEQYKLRQSHIDILAENPDIPYHELPTDSPLVLNLLVTMPPRHAKSTFCTVLFPAYLMCRDSRRYIMSCSYNSELATDFGRSVRNLMQETQIGQAFPGVELAKDSQAADAWSTTDGGKYFGVGIGGTTSGRPANWLIIDDPIKARDEAESITMRNKTWNYYTSALTTRGQPDDHGNPFRQIVILTRWHPDDLAGRIKDTDEWQAGLWGHLNMPAIREVGDKKVALWPERFPVEVLERRQRLNPREFASLYQQTPYIEGGNIIKADWWRRYHREDLPDRMAAIVIGVDTAFKKNQRSDYSAMCVAGVDTRGDIYILDVQRGKYEFPELRRRIVALHATWRGKGLRGLYIEDKASGTSIIQDLRRIPGVATIPYKIGTDKVARTNAVAPLIEGGRVLIPHSAAWIDIFLDEFTSFPGAHDDMVDATVIALDALSRISLTPDADMFGYEPTEALTAKLDTSLASKFKDLMGSLPWRNWGE